MKVKFKFFHMAALILIIMAMTRAAFKGVRYPQYPKDACQFVIDWLFVLLPDYTLPDDSSPPATVKNDARQCWCYSNPCWGLLFESYMQSLCFAGSGLAV